MVRDAINGQAGRECKLEESQRETVGGPSTSTARRVRSRPVPLLGDLDGEWVPTAEVPKGEQKLESVLLPSERRPRGVEARQSKIV